MVEPAPSQISSTYQLERLLRDPDFLKIVDLIAKEVMCSWDISSKVARDFVLFTVGEPETLVHVYHVWVSAKNDGKSLGRAKLLVRRHMIDLVRKGTAQPDHRWSPAATGAVETTPDSFDTLVRSTPRTYLELQQIIQRVRGAVAGYAPTKERAQARRM